MFYPIQSAQNNEAFDASSTFNRQQGWQQYFIYTGEGGAEGLDTTMRQTSDALKSIFETVIRLIAV